MASRQTRKLVIVESPTKARTIRAFLPGGYDVAASMGHVRDLPESAAEIPVEFKGEEWARIGVNVDRDFEPLYVVPASKRKVVTELRQLLKGADELILATDEDREGESIGWHLVQLLKPRIPVSRIVFHEITPEAIRDAIRTPRAVDEDLVRAQETRRILDRLVGYTLSPLLWKKIAGGLSAGRVQSVAVRLLVQRERERRAFHSGVYWDLKALLAKDASPFSATLVTLGGKRLATGRDFDEATGRLRASSVDGTGAALILLGEEEATRLRARLQGAEWKVRDTQEKPVVRRPSPPFTTSTLQQEANRKLRLSSRETMRVAQRLYEEGYITYMRTDSVHLSNQAMEAARNRIRARYGKEFLSPGPRHFTTKSKGAQEAHEAIRPAGTEMKTAEELRLSGAEAALYDLIWKRTVASQMADARLTYLTVQIDAADAVFRASGRRIEFPGFFRAYVEGSDDPEAALEDREEPLPALRVGDRVTLQGLEALRHETQPPARYTEATLVKTLEAEGIGRPSTYASIIGTIVDRGYAERRDNQLVPTFTAFAVTGFLERHFPTLVDVRFTAGMEEQLDEIAEGEAAWLPYLRHFFAGPEGLGARVREGGEKIDPREASTIRLEDLSARVRIGKFGPFVEMEDASGATVTASIPEGIAPADLSSAQVEALVRAKTEGPESLGAHPDSGESIYVLTGRFGPYVQLGEATDQHPKPKRASLPKGMPVEGATLELAVRLLSLPRALGAHPESGKEIHANVGRFGPYVVHDGDFRSIPKDEDVHTIDLSRALEVLAMPKGGRAAATPLRELGAHPGDGAPVVILQGRYGPYVKHGATNASLPKGVEVEDLTVEQALELLRERAAAGGKKTKKPIPGKANAAKKSPAKKPAAKKAGTRTAAAKRPASNKTTVQKAATAKKRPGKE